MPRSTTTSPFGGSLGENAHCVRAICLASIILSRPFSARILSDATHTHTHTHSDTQNAGFVLRVAPCATNLKPNAGLGLEPSVGTRRWSRLICALDAFKYLPSCHPGGGFPGGSAAAHPSPPPQAHSVDLLFCLFHFFTSAQRASVCCSLCFVPFSVPLIPCSRVAEDLRPDSIQLASSRSARLCWDKTCIFVQRLQHACPPSALERAL